VTTDYTMTAKIKHFLLVSMLIVSVTLISADRLGAQVFKTLYTFTNNIGSNPVGGLVLSGNVLYGMTGSGGGGGQGAVFAVNTDGTGFTNLYTFTAGRDGADPYNGLILSGNTLYGSAQGNVSSYTIFKLNTDGTGFTNIADLPGPLTLMVSGNTLYGAAATATDSLLFHVNTDGSGYENLYAFTANIFGYPYDFGTNSDGATPYGALVLSGDTLYGTASSGGLAGNGTVFKVGTNGGGFLVLHTFTACSGIGNDGTNSDGAGPGAVILLGDSLYGTTSYGGSSSNGTVFKIRTDGSGFTVLHTFTSDSKSFSYGLSLSGSTLYGTTDYNDLAGTGTVYALNTDGSGFTVLHSFPAISGPNTINSGGAGPFGGLTLSGNTVYGTTLVGGSGGGGTIFSISLPPQLAITASGPNVVLTWPTNVAGLTLQSTPNLVSPVVWTPVSPGPVVVNGLNTVTNPMIGSQQFYRLSQ